MPIVLKGKKNNIELIIHLFYITVILMMLIIFI